MQSNITAGESYEAVLRDESFGVIVERSRVRIDANGKKGTFFLKGGYAAPPGIERTRYITSGNASVTIRDVRRCDEVANSNSFHFAVET